MLRSWPKKKSGECVAKANKAKAFWASDPSHIFRNNTFQYYSPQVKYKNLEAKIVKLLESSIVLAAKASPANKLGSEMGGQDASTAEMKAAAAEALNKAKEAFSLDRTLHRFRDQHGENIFHNFDLTYAVS